MGELGVRHRSRWFFQALQGLEIAIEQLTQWWPSDEEMGWGKKMRVWCFWFCALLMLDLLLEAQLTKWNANTWTTEEPMSQKPGMWLQGKHWLCVKEWRSGSPERVPGFQMKLWCLHHPIFALCPACSEVASSVKPEPLEEVGPNLPEMLWTCYKQLTGPCPRWFLFLQKREPRPIIPSTPPH